MLAVRASAFADLAVPALATEKVVPMRKSAEINRSGPNDRCRR